ncbi:MAG: 16S rRNA (guanine(966)-N(2))-methyltransferase RsmD [Pseudomonadota bacterium]
MKKTNLSPPSNKSKKPSQMGEIRIIGGIYRGRKLKFPALPGLRPTPDRVRETLFNWLGQTLEGWRVLDLFAGSGALSFEAASRGATDIIAIEHHPQTFAALKQNAELLQAPIRLFNQDAALALNHFSSSDTPRFDLIVADPPFEKIDQWVPLLIEFAQQYLHPSGWLYIESPKPLDLLPDAHKLRVYRSATAGQVCYHLYQLA